MAKAARVLAALKRDGWTETRRTGSHRVLVKGDQQRIWACHDGVDLGGPAMARIAVTTAIPLLSCGSCRTIC
jgi:predicted RNA binding protein YcfA (HicA-like mRNA interferase family)